jgi:hypothetical protein
MIRRCYEHCFGVLTYGSLSGGEVTNPQSQQDIIFLVVREPQVSDSMQLKLG